MQVLTVDELRTELNLCRNEPIATSLREASLHLLPGDKMKVFDKIDVFNSIVVKVYPDIVEIQVEDDHKDEIAYTNLSYEEWDTLVAAVAKARG